MLLFADDATDLVLMVCNISVGLLLRIARANITFVNAIKCTAGLYVVWQIARRQSI